MNDNPCVRPPRSAGLWNSVFCVRVSVAWFRTTYGHYGGPVVYAWVDRRGNHLLAHPQQLRNICTQYLEGPYNDISFRDMPSICR
jgi:hypothetical protein